MTSAASWWGEVQGQIWVRSTGDRGQKVTRARAQIREVCSSCAAAASFFLKSVANISLLSCKKLQRTDLCRSQLRQPQAIAPFIWKKSHCKSRGLFYFLTICNKENSIWTNKCSVNILHLTTLPPDPRCHLSGALVWSWLFRMALLLAVESESPTWEGCALPSAQTWF